ncbi:carbohydrate ABC transporter permease [Fundicoccus sp. Sow4_H7]|uniref:Carbohydrate ABC transporter permease n=1 Tax=Fundicoccus culcitae TaxID=2969821 RepID=A0ABY5P7X2_9LACT|nr:carbohydrate ABC transporter permease [Fundicoccus culcitae]UUX34838.1 carbohydrate ABC transporter permease [Fundicoccus culcitae]
MKARKRGLVVLEIVAIILFIVVVSPFILIIINSAKSSRDILLNPLSLPQDWGIFIENVVSIWNNPSINYAESFVSSVIITVVSLLIITLISSLAAWGLVRRKTRLSNAIFLMFVASMVIPFQVVMYPLISWFRIIQENVTKPLFGFNLLRSYWGVFLAYAGFGMGMSVFMFHGFIKGVPVEIEEAAEIDGANKFQTFVYVVLPLLKPITVTILILNGIWIWNDYLLPLLLLGVGNDIQTLPIAVANFAGSYTRQWDMILTSSLMVIAPVIIIFLFAQKQIMKGMVEGAIK